VKDDSFLKYTVMSGNENDSHGDPRNFSLLLVGGKGPYLCLGEGREAYTGWRSFTERPPSARGKGIKRDPGASTLTKKGGRVG